MHLKAYACLLMGLVEDESIGVVCLSRFSGSIQVCLVAGGRMCHGKGACENMQGKTLALWRICLFGLAEDLVSRLRFLFWGKSNGVLDRCT